MPFLGPRSGFNSSRFAASLGFCFVGSPSPRPGRMEGHAEIRQPRNSIHPGNDDVSCCQHTVGDMAGQGEGDDTNKTLCIKYNVEKWAISLTASRA